MEFWLKNSMKTRNLQNQQSPKSNYSDRWKLRGLKI